MAAAGSEVATPQPGAGLAEPRPRTAPGESLRLVSCRRLAGFLELTKPRITTLIAVTTLVGFFMGSRGSVDFVLALAVLAGTVLCSSGASALNQYLERDIDALMKRTESRPLPAGVIEPSEALAFGVFLAAGGTAYLAIGVNVLTAGLAALTLCSYLFVYTPLKRRTYLATLVGAIPGALPPVGGWAAARGELGVVPWILFATVFLWQIPHFFAIAWIYREDYERGGLPLLPVIEPDGRSTGRQALLYALALLPVSLLPVFFGAAGRFYFASAILLGIVFIGYSLAFARERASGTGRRLFLFSVAYLPLLWAILMFDKIG